jgi:hypothetical protein
MKKIKLTLLLLLTFGLLSAQNKYGNEWIKKDQSYLKVKISEKGVYKLSYLQLQSQGFLNNNPNPKNFQIFYLGEEIFINVVGEQDGSFDPNDFIEFYAETNNGKFDTQLYKNGEQPNNEVSLFSDEAVYFLTVDKTNFGKRFTNVTLQNSGLTPESHILFTSSLNFSDSYYPGLFVLEAMTFSNYIEGEGYLGNTFSLGTTQTRTIATPNFINIPSFKTNLQTYVAGRSNASSTNNLGNNHHLNISIGNNVIKDTLYRGYKTIRINQPINNISLANTTEVKFSSINDLGAITDFQTAGYLRINYSRNLDAQNYKTLNFKLNSSNPNCLLNFTNTNAWSNSKILNTSSGKIYNSSLTGNNTSFVIENSNDEYYLYNDDSFKTAILEKTSFNLVDASIFNAKMLMVTHTSLLSAVNELSTYKNSMGVSNYVITTDEIYNQFSYGIHHPLGIRNLSKYLIEKATIKPEYLFLVGKGYNTPRSNLNLDLVPTMGFPASDNEFTSKIIDNNLAPALATGRFPAKTSLDVTNYIEKLKLFNNQPSELWRKTFIHITGGGNSFEDLSFANSLRSFSNVSDKEFFGSKTITYYKNTTAPITPNFEQKINKTIAEGANLVTFLGHGSATGTAVSVGRASELDKVLFFFINGCSTGNVFTSTNSLGEEFVLEKNKGAVGWIGTTSEGVASYLTNLGLNLYQNSFKNNYGKSVAQNISTSIRAYQNQNDALNTIHCQQYMYLGDPSVSFYSPDKPDYEIKPNSVSILESNINANSASFNLSIIVNNNGKAIKSPIKVGVKRVLSDNSIIDYPVQIFNDLFNTDTIKFLVNNDITKKDGNNKFIVSIDPLNEIEELNKQNNTSEFTYLFASNGITIISPEEYSIVSNTNLDLKIQTNNLFTKQASFYFEIDTLSSFNSPFKKSSGLLNANLFAEWKPNILLTNNKVYYWRARLDADPSNGGQWQNSSFTYINGSSDGWSQAHENQFTNITLNNITSNFNYTNTVYPIVIRNRGKDSPTLNERRIRLGASNTSASFNGSGFEGIGLIALSRISPNIKLNYNSEFNYKNDGINGTGMFFFNTNNSKDIDSLISYINNIPENYYVLGLTGTNFSSQTLNINAKNAFKKLGLSQIENIGLGEPYVFVSTKGALQNSPNVTEIKSLTSEDITLFYDLEYPWDNGDYISGKIGPAKKWSSANINLLKNNNDVINISVIGVQNNGNEITLKQTNNPQIDLSDINSSNYPYLKLKVNAQDNKDFSLAKLSSWKILYDKSAETTFNTNFKNDFHSKEVQEGDSIKISLGLTNLKNIKSDSIEVNYKITKQDRSLVLGKLKNIAPLNQNENYIINLKLPTISFGGENILQLNLKPKTGFDQLEFNNFITYNFTVVRDSKEPLVDVAFDGKHIINGETVSPNPNINIFVLDDNKFILLKDTSTIKVYLKSDENGPFKRVSFSSGKLLLENAPSETNNKVTYIFKPGLLEDGKYTLKITSEDATGNSTKNDYSIEFEITNQQTITNFLPYPNPVTTSTRFVFKLTGQKVPDDIKIQIFSQSGKIVKEILKQDLGNISIGNNITDYAWDGTDTFGDRLANGVYFYKVIIKNNDQSNYKNNFDANTDKMFKNNMGKLYLLK